MCISHNTPLDTFTFVTPDRGMSERRLARKAVDVRIAEAFSKRQKEKAGKQTLDASHEAMIEFGQEFIDEPVNAVSWDSSRDDPLKDHRLVGSRPIHRRDSCPLPIYPGGGGQTCLHCRR